MNSTRHDSHQPSVAGSVSASATSPLAADKAEFPKSRYIDIHTHVGQTWNSKENLTADMLLRWMDSHGIAQAVVLPLISPEASSYPLTSDFVLAETRPHRDRLIPFCSVDPRTSYPGGHDGLVDMLKRYMDAGAKGFGEHKPGVAVDDPRNMAIYAACSELRLPLLFHLDTRRNFDELGLPGLAKALESAPDCNFIGHGPGWWASISGDVTALAGRPGGEISPGGAIDELMDRFDNLYGDLSAESGANSVSRDLEFGREFLIRRQDRLMFGTDYLFPGQPIPQFELFEARVELPEKVQQKIFRDNARRVLGLG